MEARALGATFLMLLVSAAATAPPGGESRVANGVLFLAGSIARGVEAMVVSTDRLLPDWYRVTWTAVRTAAIAPVMRVAVAVCLLLSAILLAEVLFMSFVSLAVKLLRLEPEKRYKWETMGGDLETGSSKYPMVLVQIPMYNEKEVYKLSIGAACGLSWPSDRIIIQVLDDSTDPEIKILKKQELDLNLITVLNNWNTEFVKVKFLHGDYNRKYAEKAKELSLLEIQLAECRTEMANLATSYSLQLQEVDRAREELVEAKTEASYTTKDLQTHISKISDFELQVKDLQARLSEKEVALSRAEAGAGQKAIEEFKRSTAFKSIIQEHVQKAIDHVYDVEVKGLELQSLEEGLTRGFLKGTRLVYRRTGAEFEDLSPIQASQDPSPDNEEDTESSSPSSDKTITSI